jgi:MFS family permease
LGATETVSWGILYYAFSVFIAPMEADLGWSRGQLTGAYSLALLLSGVAAVPVGRWLDRHGPRALMTAGSCAGTVLVLAWAGVHHLAVYYAIWAGIGLAMAAVLYDPAFATMARWFHRRRMEALTAITLMAALASTIFIPLANWLVQRQGWRPALVTLAAILGVATILPHATLLRRRPEDLGLLPDGNAPHRAAPTDGRPAPEPTAPEHGPIPAHATPTSRAATEAIRRTGGAGAAARGADVAAAHAGPLTAAERVSFGWLSVSFCLATLSSVAVSVHFLPYLQGRGYDATAAATATGLIGAMQILGRLLFAPLGGRVTLRAIAAAALLAQPLALVVLLLFPGTLGLYAFVVVFGAGRGAATLARPTLVADLFGPLRFGRVNGVLALLTTLAQSAAPLGAGLAYDRLGTYEPVFWLLAGIGVLSGAAVLPAARPRRSRRG